MLNLIMHDGSRMFGDPIQHVPWDQLRDHFAAMPGAEVTAFVTDHVTEAWIDFTYKGHNFSVNTQYGEYWFFVDDPTCSEEVLQEVLDYSALAGTTATGNQ